MLSMKCVVVLIIVSVAKVDFTIAQTKPADVTKGKTNPAIVTKTPSIINSVPKEDVSLTALREGYDYDGTTETYQTKPVATVTKTPSIINPGPKEDVILTSFTGGYDYNGGTKTYQTKPVATVTKTPSIINPGPKEDVSLVALTHGYNYEGAIEACKAKNMELVRVTSEVLNNQVFEFAKKNNIGRFFIQGRLDTTTNEFKYKDGSKLIYTNWHKGEPSNDLGKEHCIEGNFFKDTFQWNDIFCYIVNIPICAKG